MSLAKPLGPKIETTPEQLSNRRLYLCCCEDTTLLLLWVPRGTYNGKSIVSSQRTRSAVSTRCPTSQHPSEYYVTSFQNSTPCAQLPTGAPTRARIFFWFTSDVLLKRPISSFWDSYVKFLPGGLQAKVVPKRTTYCINLGVPRRVPSSVSESRLLSNALSWEKRLRNPKD